MQNPRILELLAQGITATQVLNIVGCSKNYLVSLIEDAEFKALLEERQQEYFKEVDEDEVVDNKYLALEAKILKQIENQLPTADMRESLKALEVVANRQEKARQRRTPAAIGGNTTNIYQQVNLSLPSHVLPEYTLNSNKEIVAINGRTMAPMSGLGVKELFKSLEAKEKIVQAA